jgi:hypothetical protein
MTSPSPKLITHLILKTMTVVGRLMASCRINNLLPQVFRVSLIMVGGETSVEHIRLDAQNHADIPVDLTGQSGYAVLVVSGTTRFTRQKAIYQFTIQ